MKEKEKKRDKYDRKQYLSRGSNNIQKENESEFRCEEERKIKPTNKLYSNTDTE